MANEGADAIRFTRAVLDHCAGVERVTFFAVLDNATTDNSLEILKDFARSEPRLKVVWAPENRCVVDAYVRGYREALAGGCEWILEIDAGFSHQPNEIPSFLEKIGQGYDCVFGSRFIKGGHAVNYPKLKLGLNRCANLFLRLMFNIPLNDTTNAFKAYRREVIDGCRPVISPHFNITVELPLKAIVRGYSWTMIPITWRSRQTGTAKLKIKEMGSGYLLTCLYIWREKYLTHRDHQSRSRKEVD